MALDDWRWDHSLAKSKRSIERMEWRGAQDERKQVDLDASHALLQCASLRVAEVRGRLKEWEWRGAQDERMQVDLNALHALLQCASLRVAEVGNQLLQSDGLRTV